MAENFYRVENTIHEADNLGVGAIEDALPAHRRRIEPWLSAIFQSEHLNVLLGSGFSTGLAYAAGQPSLSMDRVSIDPAFDDNINAAADRDAKTMGRGQANVEDQFRSAIALAAGLAVQDDTRSNSFTSNLSSAVAKFATGVVEMERGIESACAADAARRIEFERLLSGFLLSFASRTASRDRLHVFTTNYDRVIEHGFDLIGARAIDRFVGALTPRFRASRFDVDVHYSPPGGRGDARPLEGVVRMTKLHGSVDWASRRGQIVRLAIPFGAAEHAFRSEEGAELMIFPNSAKDIETAFYPYADLFRDFSAAICRPNSALVTYGYGFGDEHVNRVLRDMLTLPSTHLVVISYDSAAGRIEKFVRDSGRQAQVSLIVGPHLARLDRLVDHFLPKPAIDTITERQAGLLERRGRSREAEGA